MGLNDTLHNIATIAENTGPSFAIASIFISVIVGYFKKESKNFKRDVVDSVVVSLEDKFKAKFKVFEEKFCELELAQDKEKEERETQHTEVNENFHAVKLSMSVDYATKKDLESHESRIMSSLDSGFSNLREMIRLIAKN